MIVVYYLLLRGLVNGMDTTRNTLLLAYFRDRGVDA
jgi:hypothetical protein